MTFKSALQFCQPYNFNDILTIKPISVKDYLNYSDDVWSKICFPFAIPKSVAEKENLSPFDLMLADKDLFESLISSICILCDIKEVKIDSNGLYFNDSKASLNSENFPQLCGCILEMLQRSEIPKEEAPPKFETEEGYKRWKNLMDQRKKYKQKEKPSLTIQDIIHYVQFGGDFYISDIEVLSWTYWKLINVYKSIRSKNDWNELYQIFLLNSKKELITPHWSESMKL